MPTTDDAKLLEEIQRMRETLRSRLKTDMFISLCVDEREREIYFMDFFRSFINRWSRRLTRRLRA